MPTLHASYNRISGVVTLDTKVNNPAGSVAIGSFEHPDPVYPDSVVAYHGVRDLLYKRAAADPSQPAMFPDNITDMASISIDYVGENPLKPVTAITFDTAFDGNGETFHLIFTPPLATLTGVTGTLTVDGTAVDEGTLTINGFTAPYVEGGSVYRFTLAFADNHPDVVYQTTMSN